MLGPSKYRARENIMGLTHGSLGTGGLLSQFGSTAEDNPFRNPWPNTPDFTFNYSSLLKLDNGTPIGRASEAAKNKKILIIGAGVSGLLTARELRRCGFKNIDIVDATHRIGGRNYSVMPNNVQPGDEGRFTPYEMGAMRFPLFNGNSVMSYYFDKFGIATQTFPNPGTVDTGVWINQGHGVNGKFPSPDMYIWKGKPAPSPPPADFAAVANKWFQFSKLFVTDVRARYANADTWPSYWQSVVNHYRERTFLEVALLDPISAADLKGDGYYGGLGMTAEEARLFYTIGAGDGSWGAFFAISALYPIRTLLCGFGDGHRLALGRFNSGGGFSPGKHFKDPKLTDSRGQIVYSPIYVGIQSLPESLFYHNADSVDGDTRSLFDQLSHSGSGIRLFLQTEIKDIIFRGGGIKTVVTKYVSGEINQTDYSLVISTPTTWATQLSYGTIFRGLPAEVWDAFHLSHWITSCKVFYPLKERYWKTSKIPQIIVSDTTLQDSYAYANEGTSDPGVLLTSYTWEDDAQKFMADSNDKLFAQSLLDKLGAITYSAKSVKTNIKQYIASDLGTPAVIHWTREHAYRGCAKLYRPGSEFENYTLLSFNQKYGKQYGVYVCGEASSVYGGWTEPALRHGLDTVINILNDTGGTFKNGFSYSQDYPKYSDTNLYAGKGVLNYCPNQTT